MAGGSRSFAKDRSGGDGSLASVGAAGSDKS